MGKDRQGRTASPQRRVGLALSTGLLSLLAGVIAYVGVAIAFTVARGNGDAKALAASVGYVTGALGVPIAAGFYLAHTRGWGTLRAIRFAAAVSLLVHVTLLPVALAALAM